MFINPTSIVKTKGVRSFSALVAMEGSPGEKYVDGSSQMLVNRSLLWSSTKRNVGRVVRLEQTELGTAIGLYLLLLLLPLICTYFDLGPIFGLGGIRE